MILEKIVPFFIDRKELVLNDTPVTDWRVNYFLSTSLIAKYMNFSPYHVSEMTLADLISRRPCLM